MFRRKAGRLYKIKTSSDDVYAKSGSGFLGFLVDKGIKYSTKGKTLQITKDLAIQALQELIQMWKTEMISDDH